IIASTEYVEIPLVSAEEVDKAKKALTEDQKKKKVAPKYPFVHGIKEGKPVVMKVHIRGNPATLGEDAPRGFLSILTTNAGTGARGEEQNTSPSSLAPVPSAPKGSGRLE